MMHTSRMVGVLVVASVAVVAARDVREGGDYDGEGRTDGHGCGARCADRDQ